MHASGIVEAENKVLKRHATGTRPNQDLVTSAQTITKLNVRQTNLLKKRVASSLDATIIQSKNPYGGYGNSNLAVFDDKDDDGHDLDDVDNDENNDESTLVNNNDAKAAEPANAAEHMFTYLDEIVDYRNQMIEKKYKQSSKLSMYKVDSKLYYVKATAVKLYKASDWQYWVPQYCRTRKVRVITYTRVDIVFSAVASSKRDINDHVRINGQFYKGIQDQLIFQYAGTKSTITMVTKRKKSHHF
jgi:hypothetical protein